MSSKFELLKPHQLRIKDPDIGGTIVAQVFEKNKLAMAAALKSPVSFAPVARAGAQHWTHELPGADVEEVMRRAGEILRDTKARKNEVDALLLHMVLGPRLAGELRREREDAATLRARADKIEALKAARSWWASSPVASLEDAMEFFLTLGQATLAVIMGDGEQLSISKGRDAAVVRRAARDNGGVVGLDLGKSLLTAITVAAGSEGNYEKLTRKYSLPCTLSWSTAAGRVHLFDGVCEDDDGRRRSISILPGVRLQSSGCTPIPPQHDVQWLVGPDGVTQPDGSSGLPGLGELRGELEGMARATGATITRFLTAVCERV